MISEAQLKRYDQEGYLILENLFSKSEMDALSARIDPLDHQSQLALAQKGKTAGPLNFSQFLTQKDPAIQNFACQDRFVEITTALVGPDIQLYNDQSVYKKPESAKKDFPWHQDNGYRPIEPQHYLTCWLALGDSTVENGCIWIQPGSHRQGLVEHQKTDAGWQCYFGEDPGIPVELKQGSMVVFHSLLFHCSTPNLSNQTRKGYVLQYSRVGAYDPRSGEVYNRGPVIAVDGKAVVHNN